MRRRALPLLAVLTMATVLSSVADGASHPIAQLEVSTRVARDGKDMREQLRSKIVTQLGAVDWSKTSDGGPFVLSTALVRLDTDTVDGEARVSCAVSMALRDQKRGSLRAIVEGRSRSENRADAAATAEDDAMRIAVRSAVRSLPEAIRRSR